MAFLSVRLRKVGSMEPFERAGCERIVDPFLPTFPYHHSRFPQNPEVVAEQVARDLRFRFDLADAQRFVTRKLREDLEPNRICHRAQQLRFFYIGVRGHGFFFLYCSFISK